MIQIMFYLFMVYLRDLDGCRFT